VSDRIDYNPWLHRLAVATACATFPLIFLGGLVTSHGAGMSVPDWPNSYGYNMFAFPPSMWVGGIFYEHTHRLMGTVVGMLSIALAVAAWKAEPRRWARWLCYGVLAAVIFQGVLGGLRVVLVKLDLAIVHACFAQAFFCLAACAAIVTSRWWREAPDLSVNADAPAGRRLIVAGVLACVAIYAQLIVGATMRHYQAGLAVPDLPLAYGQVFPSTDAASLDQINQHRAWELNLGPVTQGQVWLHMGHRIGAIIVTLAIAWLIVLAIRRDRGVALIQLVGGYVGATLTLTFLGLAHAVGSTRGVGPGFLRFCVAAACGLAAAHVIRAMRTSLRLAGPATVLAALLTIQLTLGVLTVLYRKPADVASAHVAAGALTLVTCFLLTVRSVRLFGRARRTVLAARETNSNELDPNLVVA
jgi:cytochrome c oxidase assembly protein subunit 15